MRYKVITGTLVAKTAVHIGTGVGNELTDALMRRDSRGRPFVPGTAIAGALRTLLVKLAPRLGSSLCELLKSKDEQRKESCNCAVCSLFGDVNPSDELDSNSTASRLIVFNAYRDDDKHCHPMIRDGVGIHRATGTAARAGSVKFDFETIPAETSFELRMELRGVTKTGEQLLAAALSEWEQGRLRLGGRVACGLGSFKLKYLQYKTTSLDSDENLISFLREDKPWTTAKTEEGWLETQLGRIKATPFTKGMPRTISRNWFSFEGTLQAKGPLLTNDALSSFISGFDHAPTLSGQNSWLHPVLPGASLRGVLRTHAERLARTLATLNSKSKDDFLSCCPACDPNVNNQDKAERLPLESCGSLLINDGIQDNGETADIAQSLCLACSLFGSTKLGSRLIVEDAPFKSGDGPTGPKYKMLDFLAIDRFTGGGVDGAKFDALALWKPAFYFNLFLENPESWELGWLQLVLRDLEEGWLSVGFGNAKGFGKVKLTGWKATFGYLLPENAPPGVEEIDAPTGISGIYTTKTVQSTDKGLTDMMQNWLKYFIDKTSNYQRPESIRLTTDNYFDDVKDIYCSKGGTS